MAGASRYRERVCLAAVAVYHPLHREEGGKEGCGGKLQVQAYGREEEEGRKDGERWDLFFFSPFPGHPPNVHARLRPPPPPKRKEGGRARAEI